MTRNEHLEQPLADLLARLTDRYADTRYAAVVALGELRDPRTVEPLIGALHDRSKYVRERAAYVLAKLGTKQAVEPLITALDDSALDVRQAAAYALGHLGDERAIDPLVDALADDPAPVAYSLVVSALHRLGRPALLPTIASLRSRNATARRHGMETLRQFHGDYAWAKPLLTAHALEPLLDILADPNADLRRFAIVLLSEIGDPRAVEPLLTRAEDEDSRVRWELVQALKRLGDRRALPTLDHIRRYDTGEVMLYGPPRKKGISEAAAEAIASIQSR